MIDEAVISYVVRFEALTDLQSVGVSIEDFEGEYRTVWRHLLNSKRDHDATPSRAVLKSRFPDINLPRVAESDLPILLRDLRSRRKYRDFLTSLSESASKCTDHESVDEAVSFLQGKLNELSTRNGGAAHLVNAFDSKQRNRFVREIQQMREDRYEHSVQTGLATVDRRLGGLRRQKYIVIIGRPGLGKSWLDLLFVAQAVMQGKTVILYPLEMSLFDTCARLYTIFTQSMFGPQKVIKNQDMTQGNVSTRRVRRFIRTLEDQLPGTLHIADMASLSDPYTVERIEAEVELHKPDMFWVDYLTLLRPPPGSGQTGDWHEVRMLSNGIKNIAMRRDTIGGASAQVNREALKTPNLFLPRLENIAYGDSIGQDADMVFSINRKRRKAPGLYYALVKNRGGQEFGGQKGIRVSWNPNEGLFEEMDREES